MHPACLVISWRAEHQSACRTCFANLAYLFPFFSAALVQDAELPLPQYSLLEPRLRCRGVFRGDALRADDDGPEQRHQHRG